MRSHKGCNAIQFGIFMGAIGAVSAMRKGSVSKLIAEGNEQYRKGKLAEAIKAYNQALEIDPENPDAWNNKGLILAVAGNYKEALNCHLKAVDLDPDNVDAISNIGMIHTKMENSQKALEWYDKALSMDPNHQTTWNNKGNLLSKMGQYQEALRCYDKALEINPEYMAAMNNKAVELIHLKRYDEALGLLNSVLKSRPLFSEGWYVKGKAYVGMGDFEKAIICLERSHRLNPDFHQAKRALDVLKTKLVQQPAAKAKPQDKKQIRTASAQEKLEKSIQKEILKPRTDSEIISDEFRRPEEHLTPEERAISAILTDDYVPISGLKEMIPGSMTKASIESALAGLEKKGLATSRVVGKAKEYSRTQSLGAIEEEMIEEREEQEPEDAGNDIHALMTRARRYLDSGRYQDAASNLKKVLKINPYDEMATCLLAQTQFETGDRDRAINTISRILSRKPDYVPAWFTLANASLKSKEYSDAAECFQKILEIQPNNAEAKKGLALSEKGKK
jgi:tetratricopeptide (TPR) repeat protein